MFTPSNIKKLTNVAIITLKAKSISYEVPIYPNTLQSYLNGLMPLSSILHVNKIYKSVSTGALHTQKALEAVPGKTDDEKIDYILRNGNEKKEKTTREHDTEKKIRGIAAYIMGKVKYKGRWISHDGAISIVKRYDVSRDAKTVGNSIVRDLTRNDADYEKEKFLVKVDERHREEMEKRFGPEKEGPWFKVDGDDLKQIRSWCEERRIALEIRNESEDEEEIIC